MKKLTEHEFDIVIVGGGIVGASFACLLEGLPISVALVDQSVFESKQIPFYSGHAKFDARVSAITRASMELFEEIEVWEAIENKRCCKYQNMQVWDADGTGAIEFSAADIQQSSLGTIVENSIVLSALQERLKTISNLTVIAPAVIEDFQFVQAGGNQSVNLTAADGSKLNAKLLVAADGANSKIRQLANFSTREWDYNHQALVTTVRTEKIHNYTALQRFMDTGPLAFLPLNSASQSGEEHYSSIVWSMVPDKADTVMALSDEAFRIELAAAIEHRLGVIEWSDKRVVFPLRQRHAKNYIQENIVLVGDAAHSIHPLAGQGVNLGLLDVKALAKELKNGFAAGRQIGDEAVLRRYQRQRIGHNLGMMSLMEGFKYLFAERSLPVRWLRNFGMTRVDNFPLMKNQLARRAMGLDW